MRDLRARLGLSQQQVAAAAEISLAYYGALERGDKRINADTAQRLQTALHCTVADLLTGGAPAASLPLRYIVAAAESESRPAAFDLPEPWERLPVGRLADPAGCVAAELADDSADLDFAQGTLLFVRPLSGAVVPLPLGAKILVRFLLDPNGGGAPRTHEILYGILDQSILGDLLLITRSRNRLVPRTPMIQQFGQIGGGLAEAPLALRRPGGVIDYAARAGDPAEILGIVEFAAGPTKPLDLLR